MKSFSSSSGGTPRCTFTLVVHNDYMDKGYRDEVPCIAWRDMVEQVQTARVNARFIGVNGRLKSYRGQLQVNVAEVYEVRTFDPPEPLPATTDEESPDWMIGDATPACRWCSNPTNGSACHVVRGEMTCTRPKGHENGNQPGAQFHVCCTLVEHQVEVWE